ncbi:MAG TPA: O-antigen ligase family protein [Kofleriaceae bacterium]|nr:O-antigen ligase family protein [Kofleriaceae bacterium]
MPGIIALVFFIYVRPQEIVTDLQRLPLLYMFFALAIFGLAVDLRLRINKFSATPQLPFAVMLFLWALLSLGVKAPEQLIRAGLEFAVAITLYVVVAHSVHTFRAFQIVTGLMMALVLILACVGVHQGLAPYGCVRIDPKETGDITVGIPDGRSCRPLEDLDCYLRGEPEPGADYICEHIGLFGTTSVAGRVRYRGVLQDPNELALVLGVGLPFVLAFAQRRRSPARVMLAAATVAAVAVCAYFTQSRGGQLVIAASLWVYSVYLWRWKAVAAAALLAPVVLFVLVTGGDGGRVDAAASTEERYEAWMTGINLFRSSPLIGVGHGQFVEHHYLTAHNSYILALAELGFPGLLLWGAVLYLSVKTLLLAVFRYYRVPEARVAFTWALALLASFTGLMVGIFFLSFAWHFVFWIYVGLAGAFYSATRTHDPGFEVRMGGRDWLLLLAMAVALVAIMFAYLRLRGY